MLQYRIPGILAPRYLKRFKDFAEDKRGMAAVEFALIAVPFMFLIFGLLEICMMFVMSAVLDHGISEAARQIRTGQFQAGSATDKAAFKQTVCAELFELLDCGSKLDVDVKIFTDFGSTVDPTVIKPDGTIDTTGFTFNPGGANEIVVVRVFYEWELFTPVMSAPLANLSGGKRLLQSTTTFRNEPF